MKKMDEIWFILMNAVKIYCHVAAIHEVKKVQNLRRSALKNQKI